MTLSQKAVEAASLAFENGPDAIESDEALRLSLEAAITAALAVDGLCLVPKEPTSEMIAISEDLARRYFKAPPVDLYKAMIAAAVDPQSKRED